MNTQTQLKKTRHSQKKLHEYIREFLGTFENKETRGTYERSLREFVRWLAKNKGFRFQVKDVERYKSHLTKTKKLSEVSVSTYLTALRRLCFFLVQQRVLSVNPAKFVGGYKRPMFHSREFLSDEDVRRLLETLNQDGEIGLRDCAIIRLMLECGLSEAEVVSANVEDCTIKDGKATLAVQGKGKTTKADVVALPESVVAAIEQYIEKRRTLYGEGMMSSSPLFLSAGNRIGDNECQHEEFGKL